MGACAAVTHVCAQRLLFIATQGIWGSGLSISAAMGVRDCNEASWTQVLEVLDFMAEATDIPILLDGDTGYGNFNNARRLINKLESRGVAGVCLEDKLFPKTNSLLEGDDIRQPLAPIAEFCGKIDGAWIAWVVVFLGVAAARVSRSCPCCCCVV